MENASKALVIAGAILISILLVTMGILIYRGATERINSSTSQMSAQQIQMANEQFTAYAGKKISGTKVKSLVSLISANKAADDDFQMVYLSSETDRTGTETAPSEIESTHKYTVKFEDLDGDGLLDAVYIHDNNVQTN